MSARLTTAVEAVHFRALLRDARTSALADAEGYRDVFVAIEAVGSYLANGRTPRGLGGYAKHIAGFIGDDALAHEGGLLDALRVARNDAIHEGAAARRMTAQATEVALRLEEAMAERAKLRRVQDYMVAKPRVRGIVAHVEDGQAGHDGAPVLKPPCKNEAAVDVDHGSRRRGLPGRSTRARQPDR
ncbi:MAG: hypothetical protein HY904_22990 [Deltaproteobacteria bacterium]|nr:hypothetical protein [Deltaproteobacteria bacterium]